MAVPLRTPLLDLPLLAWLGDLALVLLQGLDLEVDGLGDVDEVVALCPERDPDLIDDVWRVALLEEAAKGARIAGVRIHGGERRPPDREVVGGRAAPRHV